MSDEAHAASEPVDSAGGGAEGGGAEGGGAEGGGADGAAAAGGDAGLAGAGADSHGGASGETSEEAHSETRGGEEAGEDLETFSYFKSSCFVDEITIQRPRDHGTLIDLLIIHDAIVI